MTRTISYITDGNINIINYLRNSIDLTRILFILLKD